MTTTAKVEQAPPAVDPLDALLRRLSRAGDPRVRRWAAALLDGGESAEGPTTDDKSNERQDR